MFLSAHRGARQSTSLTFISQLLAPPCCARLCEETKHRRVGSVQASTGPVLGGELFDESQNGRFHVLWQLGTELREKGQGGRHILTLKGPLERKVLCAHSCSHTLTLARPAYPPGAPQTGPQHGQGHQGEALRQACADLRHLSRPKGLCASGPAGGAGQTTAWGRAQARRGPISLGVCGQRHESPVGPQSNGGIRGSRPLERV